MFFSWRNIQQAIVFELQENRMLSGGLVREIQTESGLNRFRLSGRLQMSVENQVRVLVQAQRHAVGLDIGNRAGLPKQEMTIGIKDFGFDGQFHAGEASAGLRLQT